MGMRQAAAAALIVLSCCVGCDPTARTATAAPNPASATRPALPPVKLVVAGDSLVAGDVGWGDGLARLARPEITIVNLAHGGSTSKSYRKSPEWAEAMRSGADFVLIEFGTNDAPGSRARHTTKVAEFKAFLSMDVADARAARIVPVLVTPPARRVFGPDGKIVCDVAPYAAAVIEVGQALGVPVIDLHAWSVDYFNKLGPARTDAESRHDSEGTTDRTHLSDAWKGPAAGVIADALRTNVPDLGRYFVTP